MRNRVIYPTLAILVGFAASAHGQVYQRRAAMVGGGNPDFGRCTVSVVVDGAADLEIRGDNANLRNLSGAPPQWQTFQCTGAMPMNPANLRFQQHEGRGRVSMLRDPGNNNGVAVIRMEDPEGGRNVYSFDVTWSSGQGGYGNGSRDREPYGAAAAPDVTRACREEVRTRAAARFGTPEIQFNDLRMDPDGDRVVGSFFLRRDRDRDNPYQFSCAVNRYNGGVRSVDIRQPNMGDSDRMVDSSRVAVQNCQNEVNQRVRNRGFDSVQFNSIRVDDRPGRNDWVVGSVRAGSGWRASSFGFSCRVDLNDGDVRSVDIERR